MRSVTLINSGLRVRGFHCASLCFSVASARSFIAEFPCEPFYFRRKPFAVGSPTQRAFQALRLGARSAQYGVFQKETVLAETRALRAEAGVGRTLGMFHFLNCCVVGAQSKPARNLAEMTIGVGED